MLTTQPLNFKADFKLTSMLKVQTKAYKINRPKSEICLNSTNNVLRVFKTNKYDLKVDLKLNENVAG